MNEIEIKREKYKKYFIYGIIGVVGLAVAPFIFIAIGGILGLAAAFALGASIMAFAPWFSMKLANWKVKAIVSEAKENPIETMTNLIIAKKEAFGVFKQDVENDVAGFSTFKQRAEKFMQTYPARAQEFRVQIENMSRMVEQKKAALKDARDKLSLADLKLEEMKAYWEMSQLAQKTNKSMGLSTGDAYEKLKAETASDAVFESVNLAFAQMEVASTLSIDHNPSQTLDQTVVPSSNVVDAPVKVLAKQGA